MEFTEGNLLYIDKEWFGGLYPNWRFGQTICNQLNVPREIEEQIFYEENTSKVRMIVWKYFGQ